MGYTISPLRYPGGKYNYFSLFRKIIEKDRGINTFVEPFCGGAGLGLALLYNNLINKLIINDSDPFIHALWFEILNNPRNLKDYISNIKVDVQEFKRRKELYSCDTNSNQLSNLEKALTCLFINRTTRSGIYYAGPIGGKKQKDWKIYARWKPKQLIEKIDLINQMKDKIELHNIDYHSFISGIINSTNKKIIENYLFFLDPPYYKKGKNLYFHYFEEEQHKRLSDLLKKMSGSHNWIVTYDSCTEVKELYQFAKRNEGRVSYSVAGKKEKTELIYFSDSIKLIKGKFGSISVSPKRRINGYKKKYMITIK